MTAAGAGGPIPLTFLAAQPLLLGCVLMGFRRATRLPSELRASSTFHLAWSGTAAPFISGVKRAGWVAVVAPALFGLAILHAAVLGPRVAALHFCTGLAASWVVMEAIFVRLRGVPFVSPDVPTVDVKLRVTGFLVALFSLSFALAAIERWALIRVTPFVTLLAALTAPGLALAVFNRISIQVPVTFDDEELHSTQHLNLAQ